MEIDSSAHPHLRFSLRSCSDEVGVWESLESPGPLFRGAETSRFGTIEEAVDYIGEWLGRVDEDLAIMGAGLTSVPEASGDDR